MTLSDVGKGRNLFSYLCFEGHQDFGREDNVSVYGQLNPFMGRLLTVGIQADHWRMTWLTGGRVEDGGQPDLTPTPNAESHHIYATKKKGGVVLVALGKQASMVDADYQVNSLEQVMSQEVQFSPLPTLFIPVWMDADDG